MKKYKGVILPNKPQFDPLAAYYLLIRFGKYRYPGIFDAKVYLWEKAKNPTQSTLDQWEKEGVLPIDVGGSRFDHHQKGGRKSASLLVAEDLGIDKNPEIQTLITYTQEDELRGLHNRYGEISAIIKAMHLQGLKIDEIIRFTMLALDALQFKEEQFFTEVKEEFEKNSEIIKVKRGKGKVKIAVIKSDNQRVAQYAMSQKYVAVVIQKKSTGHTFIFTNRLFRINLNDIVGAIRRRELELMGEDLSRIDLRKLKIEEKHRKVPIWYYFKSLNALMNGSEALSDTAATKIPLDEIVKIVAFGVSSKFPPYCEERCIGEKCEFYEDRFYKCERRSRK